MYHNLSAENYKALYAKYLGITSASAPTTSHSADQLLDEARFEAGNTVYDLCAGVLLRATRAAWTRGAKTVVAVDSLFSATHGDHEFVPYGFEDNPRGTWEFLDQDQKELENKVYIDPHEVQYSVLQRSYLGQKFDVVICQQGINYWFIDELSIKYLVECMAPGGRFVFNTFYKPPSTYPDWKTYYIDGKIFGEAFYMVDGMVHHLQMREGIAPHYTIFKWLPRESFHVLHKYFLVSRITEGNTDIYCCTLK